MVRITSGSNDHCDKPTRIAIRKATKMASMASVVMAAKRAILPDQRASYKRPFFKWSRL